MPDEGLVQNPRRSTRRRLPMGAVVGALFLLAMLGACLGSLPWTIGHAPGAQSPRFAATELDGARLPPAWAPHRKDERERLDALGDRDGSAPFHLLGTDALGRDLLARALLGGAISLGVGVSAAILSVAIGALYGLLAGYAGGRTDAVMMRIVDILYGLPYILLVVLLAIAAESLADRFGVANRAGINLVTLLVAIGGVSWLTMARVVRGQTLSLKERPFVEAARAAGASPWFVMRRHIFPNLLGVVAVYATLTAPQAILQESFLSFLGIGVAPPMPSWGNLAAEGLAELNPVRSRWWLIVVPCVLLGCTLVALNLVGEGLRHMLDPRSAAGTGARP